MATEKLFLHALSFFFFVLLGLLAQASAKVCPPCGSTPVPFPLSTGADCGDPSYKIRCANASLLFDALNGTSYAISSVSPAAQRLVIRPAPFLSAASCVTTDFPEQGIQLNSSLPFNVTSSNTIMCLNCSAAVLSSPLNCTSQSLCHVYANATAEASACGPLPICCTYVADSSIATYSIPLSSGACSAYRSFVGLDPQEPAAQWGQSAGVELQWASPREPACGTQADCEGGSNTTCKADQASGGSIRRCLCVGGLRWDPISGACVDDAAASSGGSNHTPLIAGVVSGFSAAVLVGVAGYLLYRRQRRIREARERLAC